MVVDGGGGRGRTKLMSTQQAYHFFICLIILGGWGRGGRGLRLGEAHPGSYEMSKELAQSMFVQELKRKKETNKTSLPNDAAYYYYYYSIL